VASPTWAALGMLWALMVCTVASNAWPVPSATPAWAWTSTVASWAVTVSVAGWARATLAEPVSVFSNRRASEPQDGHGDRWSGSKVGASSSLAPQLLQ
jgi:hypothetical protein